MTLSHSQTEELRTLLSLLAERKLTAAESTRLNELLAADPEAQRMFAEYLFLEACLELHGVDSGRVKVDFPPADAGVPDNAAAPNAAPTGKIWEFELPWEKPKVVIETSPPTPIPWYSVNSPIGLHLIAHTISAVLLLIGLGILSMIYISHNYEIAAGKAATSEENSGSGGGSSGALATAEKAEPKKEVAPVVGHISGMADCRWADPYLIPVNTRIRQGTKFALASGLMEITYTTGAKVILQGPCTYEVESPHGGYLALGKLTAKVTGGRRPVGSTKSQANHKSAISKFVVRTPTALITDLGTEFGVEVDEQGITRSCVFEGSARVQLVASFTSGQQQQEAVVIRENESVQVAKVDENRVRLVLITDSANNPPKFIRKMPKVLIRQRFDSGIFPVGYEFSSQTTGLGDAATMEGLWRVGTGSTPGATALMPMVSDAHARSGTKSIVITRPVDGSDPYKFEGYTTLVGTPISSGQFIALGWFYRENYGETVNMVSFWPKGPANGPGVVIFPTTIGIRIWDSSQSVWVWEHFPIVVPTETWIGLACQVDLDALTYNVWYNGGSGWEQVNPTPVPMENKTYSVDRLYFIPAGGHGTKTWIDDVLLRTGSELPVTQESPPAENSKQPAGQALLENEHISTQPIVESSGNSPQHATIPSSQKEDVPMEQ